jgi:hypothetical protein
MSIADHLRMIVFSSGLTAVMMSVLLDGHFATDTALPVPGPTPLALLAIAGVAGIVGSLIRRRRK